MSAILRSTQLRKLYIASRQLSRFSNFNKNFKLVNAIPELRQSVFGSSLEFQRGLGEIALKYKNGEEQSAISDAVPANEFIDQMLSKIDNDVKRIGHVLKKDVEAIFNQIKKSGSVSSIQSLYLIRCCGSLLCYENPPQRIALSQEIWSKLQDLGIPMDASHYNALLKSYLENEHQFSPPEFLSSMELNGLTPNRVTYQRMIEKYCCDGDLSGASAILEHMKEKDFPINESIFNNLVLGHARAKDMQGAVNMLDVMRKSGLEPSSETYASLACGFAENGDMESFSNTLHEAEEKQLYFSTKKYLETVSALARSGNNEYVDEILAKLDFGSQPKPEAIYTAMSLLNQGFHDAAYKIISSIAGNGWNVAGFYLFLKGLILKEMPLEKIRFYCQDVFDKGIHEYIYEDALRAALLYGKTDYAFELYKDMKKVGRPVRSHYIWPVLSSYAKNKDVEGIWSTLKFMSDMALPADVDTYLDFVLPHVPVSNPEEVISKIKECGQSDGAVTDALFLYFCNAGQIKAAADFYRENKPQLNLGSTVNALASFGHHDVESVVMLLKQFSEEIPGSDLRDDVFGTFLSRLFFHQYKNIQLCQSYIQEYHIQGVRLAAVSVNELCLRLTKLAPDLVRPVQNLEINIIRDQYVDEGFIPPAQMSAVQIEKRLVHVKATGGNIRPFLRHLLSHYCREKNLDRVMEIKAELDAINFTYSPASYALLVNLFVSHDNLEEAMKYKNEIDEQYPHFKLDAAKALEYIALMIKHGKIDEALEVIKNEAEEWINPRYNDLLVTSCRKLLHAAADMGNVEITQKLFQIFILDLKFAPVHHSTVEPLIKVYLVRNDYDAAIEEYKQCVINHKVFPSRNILFKKFITMKDPEHLQKVVDISAEYGGQDIALHELAAAFVECGCIQEARKVIGTLGSKAETKQLDIICYRFFKQDKVLELEQFIGITKDLHHIDRDQLYMHLLNLYSQSNDYQAALEMWNAIQEESVQPSASMLQKLAELLEKNGQTIPFVVPVSRAAHYNSNLMQYIEQRNEVETVAALRRMKKGEVHSLAPGVFTRIVDLLLEKKYLKEIVDIVQVMSCILAKPAEILTPVASKYGDAGDIDALKLLHDCMPDFAHKYMKFNISFFKAYLVREQGEALLGELEANVCTTKNLFSSDGFLMLLRSCPHLLDRAIKLADMCLKKEQFDLPKVVIWLHYFLQEKYEEAEEIYKQNPTIIMKSGYPFVKIIQAVRNSQNENLGQKLIDVANDSLRSNIKYRAYSSLLDVLVNKGKLEKAVALIEEANRKGVPTEKFLHPTLISLKQSLIEKNMPVPFVIPCEGEDSSSSGDDSE